MPSSTQAPEAASQPAPVATAPKPRLAQAGLWTTFAVVATLLAVWLFNAAVAGSIALLANQAPSFDTVLSFFVPNLTSFYGVTIAAFGSIMAAVAAFMIFSRMGRSATPYSVPALTVGAGILGVQGLIYTIAAVGVAFTPLLTLHEGMDAGSVYLVQFLPLLLAAAASTTLALFLMRVISGKMRLNLVSLIVLIAGAVALVFGIVAVTIKSHDDDFVRNGSSYTLDENSYKRIEAPSRTNTDTDRTESRSTLDDDDDTDTRRSTRSNDSTDRDDYKGETTTSCVNKYRDGELDSTEYLACYRAASQSSSSSTYNRY